MNKVKLLSLAAAIAAAGLLLGGNVLAQGAQNATTTGAAIVTATSTSVTLIQATTTNAVAASATTTINDAAMAVGAAINATTTEAMSAQIVILRHKIAELAAAIEKNKAPVKTVTVQKRALTQAELDNIKVKVTQIAAAVAEIKKQVQIVVAMREINSKIAAIKGQVAGVSTVKTDTAAAAPGQTAKDAQIAKIKNQINELTQEYEAQKMIEAKNKVSLNSAQESKECVGDSCAAPESGDNGESSIEILPTPSTETQSQTENKGFWNSIGDFFRKIFTF